MLMLSFQRSLLMLCINNGDHGWKEHKEGWLRPRNMVYLENRWLVKIQFMNEGLQEFCWLDVRRAPPPLSVFPFDHRKLCGDIFEASDSDAASQRVSMVFSEK